MSQKCQQSSIEEVLNFFEIEIDGMGKKDGFPRNEGVPDSIRSWSSAELCELTENEFWGLIIPDEAKLLLKNKEITSVQGEDSIATMNRYAKKLELGEILPPLIIRNILSGDPPEASYYIEDGAHKALGYKIHFQTNPYKPVMAYIGKRTA